MKKTISFLTLLMMCIGAAFAQSEPMHGWHTYCASEFNQAISYGTHTTVAVCYPPEMASIFAGTQITKVAMFSDGPTNSIGGIYTCSIYLGGETPSEGLIAYTMSCDVPQGLNDWAEFDLSTPIWVTGNETIWIVWQAEQPLSPWHIGVCGDIDPSGNGIWAWNGTQWDQIWFSTGDWMVKTYFNWDEPQPQDVYVSGNHFTTGKVLKNNTLLYSITDSIDIQLKSIQVAEDGTVYGAGYAYNSSDNRGRVWMNDSCIFTADTNTFFDHIALNGNNWTVAGGNNVWQNGELLYSYGHEDDDCHIHSLAVDTTTGDIYTGGAIYLSGEYLAYASVWKNDSLLWMEDTVSSVENICIDGENLYAAGFKVANDSLSYGVIWQNDSIIYQMENANFVNIAEFEGSLYWTGISLTDTVVYIWQDGEVIYALPELSGISNLVVNESGVYYTDAQTVYKDGEVLFQPEECIITGLVVKPAPPVPTFTLTVEANNPDWGTVTGGGVYNYGDTVTIEAFPNMGCEFLYWNDSITDNPRDIVITQDSIFTAFFNQFGYTISASVSPENTGSVIGDGIYHYGETATLQAIPNPGYAFVSWNDNVTDNPRNVVVTQDSSFVATFALRQFTIKVESDHPAWGTVAGSGTYYYGDTIQISATPYLGFAFAGWDDGVTVNPRTVVVTEDKVFIAQFEIRQCVITTQVYPENSGSVNGGGSYNYGETVHLTAHGNMGYIFDRWEDGEITNPRTIFVEGDATYTAVFMPLQYEIVAECDPVEGGSVTGAGLYDYGTVATLTAIPNSNYIFICWSDGIVTNPRSVTVTGNAAFKALFYLNGTPEHTITVLANDPSLGTVTGSGTYPEGMTIEIGATPAENAVFTGWNDGNTDNPRSITVTQDMTFTALFEAVQTQYYTITVRSESPFLGSVYGEGTYPANSVINIGATPNSGFHFAGWQDGDMNNPRTITVTEDAEYIASFSANPVETYTVTVSYVETQGFVMGAGTYVAGTIATLAAIPADNFTFVKWSDNTVDNPKEVLVDHDIVLAAFFDFTNVEENGFESVRLYPNPADDKLHIEGLEGKHEISIFDALGMKVKALTLNGDSEIGINELPAGLYLLSIDGKHTVRFVKD